MDLETVSAADFGRGLSGIGLNILVRDVEKTVRFLGEVFGMSAHQVSRDFAILTYGREVLQLHADHTYHSHPLPALLPEAGPRGGGIELRLYETDPDAAAAKATAGDFGATLLQAPENKPLGLLECVILCRDGYAWLPSRRLTDDEAAATG